MNLRKWYLCVPRENFNTDNSLASFRYFSRDKAVDVLAAIRACEQEYGNARFMGGWELRCTDDLLPVQESSSSQVSN